MTTAARCFNGLTTVNVELTSRCNKNCWMCGRRKVDREYLGLALSYGDMDFSLAESIAAQLPPGIVVQLHNNGEPLLYPRFADAARLFERQIRCVDTNGKLLVERADDIIGNLETMTISTFEKDEEAREQYEVIDRFLKIKGDRKPNVIIRCLGNVDISSYRKFGCIIATRILHSPMGSFNYTKHPTVPEIGICLDLLNHLVIRRDGKVSACVRFDPEGVGIIGDCAATPLIDIWNGEKRQAMIRQHIAGRRTDAPLCRTCEFWGVPTGYERIPTI
ncbi:MAG TPA: radical SAM/SPASM domain-containing protein [Candidatus Omnitrophota bacterium]|nr:SPASM domain-containing protein [Candidatus Omnitrophota bacterium]HNQ50913.1 radical SAM/SPASM domain-containing protein [Candidatus Omnitrophota bacterium]